MNYIWSFDLSLGQTGVCIFDEEGDPVKVFSIPTSSKLEHGERLKTIADTLLENRKLYPTNRIVLEAGFSRFNLSTRALYEVHGVVKYLFSDCEQLCYPPSTIKKIVSGNGRADKKVIREIVNKKFPKLVINNDDESDAVSIGLCWFIERNKGKDA